MQIRLSFGIASFSVYLVRGRQKTPTGHAIAEASHLAKQVFCQPLRTSTMLRFLIVRPSSNFGRGARGGNLLRFLRIFHGRDSAEIVEPSDLARGPVRETDQLFLGVPTALRPEQFAKVRFRRAALFDFGEKCGPTWTPESEPWLRSITNIYLKSWVEDSWDDGLHWGTLPLRRYPGLTWHVKLLRGLFRERYPETCRRDHEVSFLGNCTSLNLSKGLNHRYHQRIEWLREIQRSEKRFSFWGGLQLSAERQLQLSQEFEDLPSMIAPTGRMLFSRFFYNLLRSKVVLTPAGNARWSYRHYEAIYAGAMLVSTDFRHSRTLIPLPLDNMLHVADHAPVVPAIETALERLAREPDLPRRNFEFLETFLQDGDYHRSKPRLMDEFLSQLDGSACHRPSSSLRHSRSSVEECAEMRRIA